MEAEQKLQQMQMIEQNLQQTIMQKQQLQAQMIELESALTELQKTKKSYKIVGNIMIAAEKEELTKDLTSKKEIVDIRVKSIEKQEQRLKEKAETLRKEIMKELKKE
ncbi:prefoldin subunit beta [Candidatus Woesearchaeota archaeon]|nr:prefoldin subunit beta [Candidatus Woesearchaeota archaeon]